MMSIGRFRLSNAGLTGSYYNEKGVDKQLKRIR